MDTIGIGILGFAHGHVAGYINRWRQHPEMGIAVKAGWDHDAARLKTACEPNQIEPAATAEALLARNDIKGVVIASETAYHCELTEKAAAAEKAIVVQKPMALTLEEADRMIAAVEKAKVPFTIAWQMRVDPQNVRMKELLAEGGLGKVFMVRRRHGLATHRMGTFEKTWHVDPKMNRDIWADDSSHPIDFIHWLLGKPETVTAELASLLNPKIPNDNGIAIFRYPNGMLAEVVCSFVCPAHENTTEIVCEKGTVIQNYGDAISCNPGVPRPEGAEGLKWFLMDKGQWIPSGIPSPAGHGERIQGLAGPLSEFFHGRRPPIATAREGRESLRMVLACYVSSKEGRRVKLDEL
ncbi:MAG: Gfo/Idh/MocA family oxidoreductase [bacterium]|nr:Gfo/Idh/MocA family oxidoreductase [bacterium]